MSTVQYRLSCRLMYKIALFSCFSLFPIFLSPPTSHRRCQNSKNRSRPRVQRSSLANRLSEKVSIDMHCHIENKTWRGIGTKIEGCRSGGLHSMLRCWWADSNDRVTRSAVEVIEGMLIRLSSEGNIIGRFVDSRVLERRVRNGASILTVRRRDRWRIGDVGRGRVRGGSLTEVRIVYLRENVLSQPIITRRQETTHSKTHVDYPLHHYHLQLPHFQSKRLRKEVDQSIDSRSLPVSFLV